ncbi:hypothetical protein A1O7_02805 [Cladophialophora yegresii CBS 114405]|uniref:MARVEL domain-containing protein n=1 Tax=Cladophialophora yegresii CBS 114405 TaxID=1182544 RepID=W9WCV0_9EURO|nr:uncharacterized protein A1O7_02805 [Cladophialophora yegresii CBS 114405]EXJ62371.1 hypothetical protein A1O7_02805 [Cladophialophora yegresii CBS 114405]
MAISSIFSGFRKSSWLHLFLRSFQLIDALVVIGMYGVDLNAAMKASKYADGKWVFAVTTGSLAAVTALIFSLASILIQYRTVALLFAWDWTLTILFAVLSGIFGSMYLHENIEMESGIHRMKTAVGFDLAGLVLWFITASFGTWWFFSERRKSSDPRREIAPSQWEGNAGLPKLSKTLRDGSMTGRSFRMGSEEDKSRAVEV